MIGKFVSPYITVYRKWTEFSNIYIAFRPFYSYYIDKIKNATTVNRPSAPEIVKYNSFNILPVNNHKPQFNTRSPINNVVSPSKNAVQIFNDIINNRNAIDM